MGGEMLERLQAIHPALPDFAELVEENAPSVVKITTVTHYGGKSYQQQVPEIFRHFFGIE